MNDENRAPGDMEGLQQIAQLVERAEVVLITSTLTRAEILQSRTSTEAMKKYDLILRRSNVVPHNVDLPIAKLTSELMDFYINTDFELLTPDAIHLATALHYNAHEFHTFDGSDRTKKPRRPSKYSRCGLLSLDGDVGVKRLKVARPSADQFEIRYPPHVDVDGDDLFQLSAPQQEAAEKTSVHLLPAPERESNKGNEVARDSALSENGEEKL